MGMMTWTKATPKTGGYYWVYRLTSRRLHVVNLRCKKRVKLIDRDRLYAFECGLTQAVQPSYYHLWLGPLEKPQDISELSESRPSGVGFYWIKGKDGIEAAQVYFRTRENVITQLVGVAGVPCRADNIHHYKRIVEPGTREIEQYGRDYQS